MNEKLAAALAETVERRKKLPKGSLKLDTDALEKELDDLIAAATFDCKGHLVPEEHLRQSMKFDLGIFWLVASADPDCEAKKKLLAVGQDHAAMAECFECGKYLSFSLAPGGKKIVAESKCEYPNGVPEIVVDLEVPSGEILLFNDLRDVYEKPENSFNINCNAGTKLHTEFYAKQGLITHFVGNSDARIMQKNKEELFIGCGLSKKYGKKLGKICTALWWYCAADKDAFEKRAGKTVVKYQKEYHDKGAWPEIIHAKVKPGTYRTTGRYHLLKKGKPEIFSTIKRIS